MKRRRTIAVCPLIVPPSPSKSSARFRNFASWGAALLLAFLAALASANDGGGNRSTSLYGDASSPPPHNIGSGGIGKLFPSLQPSGPIDDASCDVEQLEDANDSQLHSILKELQTTAFFRSFAVDLDARCPLSVWQGAGKKKKTKAAVKGAAAAPALPVAEEEEGAEESCASEGLPDLDPDAGPACGVHHDDESGGGTMPWDATASPATPAAASSAEDDEEKEEEFQCDGGSDELDDDAPPLCSLATDDGDSGAGSSGAGVFSSAALLSISEGTGWESESQKQTFAWSQQTDPVVGINEEEPCDEQSSHDAGLPDTFWVDMCSNIQAGEGLKVVNLALNPERNTGYNGTHIWRAIYEENCIKVDGSRNAPMCYEERVLYRLLSGLHTSTTLSIAKNYYPPSKRKGRKDWEPNTEFFMEKFDAHPEHLRNLHFSYVVLLRAIKKASPFLYNYEIRTGDIVDDETATILLRRLLDSTILRSCHDVFTAFDESLMFQEKEAHVRLDDNRISLEENFKGVFHNISSILDCVQCQQCKLHGKMAMLGYGTALKILFLPREELIPASLSRNEVVALINTVAKMSEAMKEIRELTTLFWASHTEKERRRSLPSPAFQARERETGGDGDGDVRRVETSRASDAAGPSLDGIELVDAAVGAISAGARDGRISDDREAELVQLAFQRNPDLMVLAKHYGLDPNKFLMYSQNIGSLSLGAGTDDEPDAIVVGSGLAGLAAALNVLDRGGKVILVEKEHRLGGNSNKASSGINACCPHNDTYGDELESFKADTIKSAGEAAQLPLIDTLVQHSAEAVQWLQERAGVNLSLLAQLGGHAHKRTHRPNNGMAGAEIIYHLQKAVKEYEKTGMVKILVDTRVSRLIQGDDGRVHGVEVKTLRGDGADGEATTLRSPNVVLATGGFAADRRSDSYLAKYRPELLKMPATAGEFSTGDGVSLATALGAGTVDMDKIQVHPTGWVDPSDPSNPNKFLAAEMMRGVGGILINSKGQRFCNELGTRAYVTDMMLEHDPHYAETKKWNATQEIPTFSLVLSSSAAEDGKKHVDLYTHKRLLTKIQGVSALADWMGIDVIVLRSTLAQYQRDAEAGVDAWGKTSFRGVPQTNLDEEVFYAGTVIPVLHYCMGGITIDTEGNVLDENRNIIPGLHAAGEVAGGVHGNNRLGGNSLLECTVYGTIVGKKIQIKKRTSASQARKDDVGQHTMKVASPEITLDELAKHNTEEDCWVAIGKKVYDLTDFADEHPAGAESIFELAGQDGTEAFEAVHNEKIMEDFQESLVGILV